MLKKALHSFNDTTDIDSYLTLFERTMLSFQIEKSRWPAMLQSQVNGKVIQVFVELTD